MMVIPDSVTVVTLLRIYFLLLPRARTEKFKANYDTYSNMCDCLKWVSDEIVCADSRDLTSFVKKNSVALTVTSPPYRNAIDYQKHVESEEEYYRGEPIWSVEDYLDEMEAIFEQVYQVTVFGGYCAIVIGYEMVKAEIIPLPSLLLTKLLNNGKWRLREEIIWNKVTAGRNGVGNRFGVTIRNPYPTYYHANVMHEYIFILSKGKPSPSIRRERVADHLKKLRINEIMKREIANSIWNITPVPPKAVEHPCPFPEQIPWRLINLYSLSEQDVILDPFNGSGQTTKVAKHLKRHFIGVDIIPQYVKLAKRRLDESLYLSDLKYVEKWGKEAITDIQTSARKVE